MVHRHRTGGRHIHALRRMGSGADCVGRHRCNVVAARPVRTPAFWLASVLVIAAPVTWCVYNATVFGDWLDFMRVPYSAKAIEMRTAAPGWPPHPGWHNPWVALLFYVKVAEMDAVAAAWGNTLLILHFAHWAQRRGRGSRCADVPSPARCCSGCPCRSTHTRLLTGLCPSSFRHGGLTPGTTRAMALNSCRLSRLDLASPRSLCWPPGMSSSPQGRATAVVAMLMAGSCSMPGQSSCAQSAGLRRGDEKY